MFVKEIVKNESSKLHLCVEEHFEESVDSGEYRR
jgi:hypothetical protein